MPARTLLVLKCDICGQDSKPFPETNVTTPCLIEGWLRYEREHPNEERSWIDTTICKHCLRKVLRTMKHLLTPQSFDILLNKP
jgi:hypothetical protein